MISGPSLPVRLRRRGAPLVIAALLGGWLSPATGEPVPSRLREALDAVCAAPQQAVAGVLGALGAGTHLDSEALDAPPGTMAQRHRLALADGSRLRVDTHRRDGTLVRVILELHEHHQGRHGAGLRPLFWAVADWRCNVRVARRLEYDVGGELVAVQVLDGSFRRVRSRLALDAPVPPGEAVEGVPVALVDAGVNYTLAGIGSRLARREDGTIVGYDYWDMDPRPFDSHPSTSPFLPRRHGTRTASMVLEDAPVATIVPLRYPRPDMSRMTRLVEDANASGVTIVNLSLGSGDLEQWQAFQAAARAHPHMLFVASAGNDGRDLDREPVYPAALDLENLITVTSADEQGAPARGSNWGRRSVHLMVPAEDLVVTGFDGYATRVSGSSYAAARVSALAACLKAAHPAWQAPELRRAIFSMAQPPGLRGAGSVAVGVLPEPTRQVRGACPADPAAPESMGRFTLDEAALYPGGVPGDAPYRLAALSLVWVQDAGWRPESLVAAARDAAAIFGQCGVRFATVTVERVRVPRRSRYYDAATAMALMEQLAPPTPAAWFVRDTLSQPAFDAEAVGRSNLDGRGPLLNTVWLTAHLRHPGISLAHELYHVVANTGVHVPETDNLMHRETAAGRTRLADWQCERLVQAGKAFDLLVDAGPPPASR